MSRSRSNTRIPCRSNSAQAKSSPRTPNCFFDSVAAIGHLQRKHAYARANRAWPLKSVETAQL
jgi:hypothetical protein